MISCRLQGECWFSVFLHQWIMLEWRVFFIRKCPSEILIGRKRESQFLACCPSAPGTQADRTGAAAHPQEHRWTGLGLPLTSRSTGRQDRCCPSPPGAQVDRAGEAPFFLANLVPKFLHLEAETMPELKSQTGLLCALPTVLLHWVSSPHLLIPRGPGLFLNAFSSPSLPFPSLLQSYL